MFLEGRRLGTVVRGLLISSIADLTPVYICFQYAAGPHWICLVGICSCGFQIHQLTESEIKNMNQPTESKLQKYR